jgi:copper(I)-binding protein
MLENLNHDLRPGTTFNVTLTFEVAGEIEIDVTVGGEAPDAEGSQLGDLRISPAWSLPAPRLGDATPAATPHH